MWKKRFQEDNPRDKPCEVSVIALWAYDTIHALASSVEKVGIQNTILEKNSTGFEQLPVFSHRPQLLKAISHIQFRGLSGNFELKDGQLQYSTFEIINVVGEGIREIGYWKEKHGISRQVDASDDSDDNTYPTSPSNLNSIIWPGESTVVPKGWEILVSGRKLRIGVLDPDSKFVKVKTDPATNATTVSGLSVDVFEAAIKRLPYAVSYEYEHFGLGSKANSMSYNDLIYQIYLQNYDVAMGDITITYNRTLYADFSVPYTESGIAMIVPVKEAVNRNTLIFLRPLTLELWFASFAFFIYTGIVILILEPKLRSSLEGSITGHFGTIVHLSVFAYRK